MQWVIEMAEESESMDILFLRVSTVLPNRSIQIDRERSDFIGQLQGSIPCHSMQVIGPKMK